MLSTASSLKPPALLLAEFFSGLFSDLGGRGKKTISWGFGNVNYPGIQVLVTGSSPWLGSGASSFCVSSRISMESELVVAIGSPQGSHGGSRFWLEFGGIVCIEPSVNTCCRAENHALGFFSSFFFFLDHPRSNFTGISEN